MTWLSACCVELECCLGLTLAVLTAPVLGGNAGALATRRDMDRHDLCPLNARTVESVSFSVAVAETLFGIQRLWRDSGCLSGPCDYGLCLIGLGLGHRCLGSSRADVGVQWTFARDLVRPSGGQTPVVLTWFRNKCRHQAEPPWDMDHIPAQERTTLAGMSCAEGDAEALSRQLPNLSWNASSHSPAQATTGAGCPRCTCSARRRS